MPWVNYGGSGAGGSGGSSTSYYTWIKYADDANGLNMSNNPLNKKFMGIATNKTNAVESTLAADYEWAEINEDELDPNFLIDKPNIVFKPELTNYVTKTTVHDNLLSTATNEPLSANQGTILKTQLDALSAATSDTITVKNTVGATITHGTIINLDYQDQTTKIWNCSLAQPTLGFLHNLAVATQDIPVNETGTASLEVVITGLNTTPYAPNTRLFLADNGTFSNTYSTGKATIEVGQNLNSLTNGSVYFSFFVSQQELQDTVYDEKVQQRIFQTNVNLQNNKIINLGRATNGDEAVNLDQLQEMITAGFLYKGLWNASTGLDSKGQPIPAAAPANNSWFYLTDTAGTWNGITFQRGDNLISDGSTWAKFNQSTPPATATTVLDSNTYATIGITANSSQQQINQALVTSLSTPTGVSVASFTASQVAAFDAHAVPGELAVLDQ